MARILIAGCGDIGTTLGQALHAAGHTVWGLRRQPGHLPAGIQPLAADLGAPETLRALPPALDAVVYSAAASGFSDFADRERIFVVRNGTTRVRFTYSALSQAREKAARFRLHPGDVVIVE